MDTVSVYSFSTLGWLSLQSLPLAVWPNFIISLLTPDFEQHASHLERYFARSLGFSQLTVGLLLIVLTGALPMTSMVDNPTEAVSPYANAAILISLLHHTASGFNSYARYNSTGQTGYVLGAVGSGVFAAFAVWCLMFGSGSHISKRTGADKRTSGFPFRNAEAEKKKQPKSL